MERTSTHASPSARVPTSRLPKTPNHPTFGPSLSSSSSSSSSSSPPPIRKWTGRMKWETMTWTHWIQTIFPCYLWMRSYKWREYLRPDLVAGVSVAVMLVPQSMSYAKQAGLHPIYGLYSGFVPVFAYAIFGSSRHVSIGPISMISLLVSNALSRIAGSSSEELYTELAILLALMVGLSECAMGLLRLGWLIRFVSRSVISGYTTATAVVIAVSQLTYFLGYALERSGDIVPLVRSIVDGADKFSWPPFVMGSILLAILIIMKHLGNSSKNLRFLRASGPLTAVVLSTIFVKIFHPPAITLIDKIPQGLPRFSTPKGFAYVKSLIPVSVMITGVAVLESMAIAKALAAKNGYEVDSNQELFGLGVANIAGSFFQVYPVTGAFSRSAVNHESGAKTGLSGIVTGIIMGCALLFLTPLFEYIPECALAAIVISAVIGLIDYEEPIYLWRVDKKQFLVWFVTCAVALFLGVEIGVLVGVGTSLAFVIQESANPRIAFLGRLPGTTAFRNIEHYSEAYTYDGIAIVRIDSPIYFANSSCIMDRLREYEAEAEENAKRIHFVIIEMTPVSYIDGHAAQALKELYREYESRNIQIAICNPSREVLSMLTRSGAVDLIGREWLFDRTHDAVEACLRHVQKLNGSPRTQSMYDDDDDDDSSLSLLERGFEDNDDDDDITSHLEKPLLSWGN